MRIAPDDRRAWWTALLLLCGMVVAPLLLVDVPPLLDYPNHLARMVLLAWPHDPTLSRFAVAHWGIIPDLAIDLTLPSLLHILPVHVAGRIMVACIVLLPVLGTAAYSAAAFGQRSWWALAVGIVAWNETMLSGFLNFTAGIGVALLLAAAWVRWRNTNPLRTALLTIPGATAVFFCHLMGLVFLASLLAAFEVAEIARGSRWQVRTALSRLGVLASVFLPEAALYVVSPLGDEAGAVAFLPPSGKAMQLLLPFVNYCLGLDVITAAAIALFLLACVGTHRARFAAGSGLAIAVLLLLFVVAPDAAKGAQNIDARFVIMFSLLLFAGILPQHLPRSLAVAATTGTIGLLVLRMTVLAMAWHSSNVDVAGLRAVIALVPAGATVFVTAVSPDEAPGYWQQVRPWRRLSNGQRVDVQLPALLLIERHAFWPFLFDNESQQPIVQRPEYRALAARVGAMPDAGGFMTPGMVDLCGFDYVLLLDAGGLQDQDRFAAGRLTMMAGNDFAALYSVQPQPRKCGGT